MRKTLLIAAATLAAGVIAAQADAVYSQNVVGYINQTIPASGYQIIGSQLINGSDTTATNGDINTIFNSGLVSSPNDPPSTSSNSVIYVWTGSGYAQYFYFNAADATTWEGSTSQAGWYNEGGALANIKLTANQAAFIYNHSGSPLTLTTVGTVFQGTNTTVINSGYNLICFSAPISTNPISTYGLPTNLTSDPVDPPVSSKNDTIYAWTGSGYAQYFYFNAADATTWEGSSSPAGFYDAGGSPMPLSVYPQVNQGFFLYHSGAAITWTNVFSVQ